jgi:hypothetical protein
MVKVVCEAEESFFNLYVELRKFCFEKKLLGVKNETMADQKLGKRINDARLAVIQKNFDTVADQLLKESSKDPFQTKFTVPAPTQDERINEMLLARFKNQQLKEVTLVGAGWTSGSYFEFELDLPQGLAEQVKLAEQKKEGKKE